MIVDDRLIVQLSFKNQPIDFEQDQEQIITDMLTDLEKAEEDGLTMCPLLAIISLNLYKEPGIQKDETFSQQSATPPALKLVEQLPAKQPTLKGKAGKTAKQAATEPIPEKLVKPKEETMEEEKTKSKTEEPPNEAPVAAPVEERFETKPVQKAKAKATIEVDAEIRFSERFQANQQPQRAKGDRDCSEGKRSDAEG
ncbi:hypothetical protein BLNAU_10810 [Blattamonas nauphoetae]|uniref:Uncharacterized protein n=1 Tax=Blattamonas nauphoetae TaxID=2049346 RepID=A0ABQ9XSY3_9EUKA|nr:hypothetical protein BLNAU_10810 [Blattamonas nauphoetae]